MHLASGDTPESRAPGGAHLPAEIVAVLRRTAREAMARHQRLPNGRCSFCSLAWIHTDATYPCPPVRIAQEFLQLTGPWPGEASTEAAEQ
ncbi:MAG: hypothetical protein ACRDUA_03225 [Micromonosporaceae bacterium]